MKENIRLRVAAISFLNPAPLLYNFEHEPAKSHLAARYEVDYTLPSQCAAQLASGDADLGLIPIAAMPYIPEVVAVPGCTIASLEQVRSIQLILRPGITLATVKTLATDAASRSSAAYVRTILHHFYGVNPQVHEETADLQHMLQTSDAALLIGDHALAALEDRDHSTTWANHTWIDVAELWHKHTDLPWVAAVWAIRPEALDRTDITRGQLIDDLEDSRKEGQSNIAAIIADWQPRLHLSAETIHHYLTQNIHYTLDVPCQQAIARFYELAASAGVLPRYDIPLL